MRDPNPKRAVFAAASMVVLVASCGARTGFLDDFGSSGGSGATQDSGADATLARDGAADAADAADAARVGCVPGSFTLTRATPVVMLTLDRSSSMSSSFGTGTRWTTLTNALASALPPIDASVQLGALTFPSVGSSGQSCAVSGAAEISPATGNAAAIIDLMRKNGPGGATPTAIGIDAAGAALASFRAAKTARAIVLATDGAPDCNSALDGATCRCIDSSCVGRPERCLDDARTVKSIGAQLAGGIPTYVVGIQSSTNTTFADVLDAMAIAGGRPLPLGSARRYYAVTSSAELDAALVTIRDQVGSCTYLSSSVPSGDGTISVSLDGTLVPYDPTGAQGWRWSDQNNGEIVLAGDACAQAASGAGVFTVDVTCGKDAGADAADAGDGGDDGPTN